MKKKKINKNKKLAKQKELAKNQKPGKLRKCIATVGMVATIAISMNAGANYWMDDSPHKDNLGRLATIVGLSTLANGGFHLLRDGLKDDDKNRKSK